MLGVKIRDVLKLHNISQVLEDRTLSGTPQCPSYLIAIKKNALFTTYIPMYSMSLFNTCLLYTSKSLYKNHKVVLDVYSKHMY